MKILLLGKGVANDGCKRLLDYHKISYDYKNIDELECFSYEYIVKSPGISLDDKIFEKLEGIIISDIELVYRLRKPFIIAVTGSNGKTTVTSMLAHVLGKKYKAIACGNIGYSFSDAVVDNPDADYYIVEVSSFQLEAIKDFSPNCAIILNISPCHIDHHKSYSEYISSKLNILKNICKYDGVVFNKDISYIKSKNNYYSYSKNDTTALIYYLNGYIYYRDKRIFKIDKKYTSFDIDNIMAVLSTLKYLNKLYLKKYIKSFKKPKYRFEKIEKYIYNDAKSTNCASTSNALLNLKKCHLICGGYDRGIPIIMDRNALFNIIKVYAYGESKNKIKAYFDEKKIKCEAFDSLNDAAIEALLSRCRDENILYSPMCASFDQYKSYIERGKEFEKIIEENKRL